jgi:predicted CopG family antitoxin
MHVATKTISIDLAAYERLRRARVRPDESFSQVIKRAQWSAKKSTAAALLEALRTAPLPPRRVLDRLERAQRADEPPEDAWTE